MRDLFAVANLLVVDSFSDELGNKRTRSVSNEASSWKISTLDEVTGW